MARPRTILRAYYITRLQMNGVRPVRRLLDSKIQPGSGALAFLLKCVAQDKVVIGFDHLDGDEAFGDRETGSV